MPLCSTAALKKKKYAVSHIFSLVLLGFFCTEGCSWNTQLTLGIAGDRLTARGSPCAPLHRSPTAGPAALVHSDWKSGDLPPYSPKRCAGLRSPTRLWVRVQRGLQLAGHASARQGSRLGSAALLQVSSSKVFLRFAVQQRRFCCYLRCSIFPHTPQATGMKQHHLKSNLANKCTLPRAQIRGEVVVNS